MKLTFLSREQEVKKCFIQLGKKFGIPPDILKSMYNYIRKCKEEDRTEPCMFYKNMTLMLCLDSYGNSGDGKSEGYHRDYDLEKLRGLSPCKMWELVDGVWVKNVEELRKIFFIRHYIYSWMRLRDKLSGLSDYMKDDIYVHMIPDGKGCEWAIKNSRLSRRMELAVGEECPRFYDLREKLMNEIRIIGEENYLISKEKYIELYTWTSFDRWDQDDNAALLATPRDIICTLRQKILYLNTSPWNEIEHDYINFLSNKETMPNEWRIFVDKYGDSSFL
jgi:hypothetical protein